MVNGENKQVEVDLKEWAKQVLQTFKRCSKRDFTSIAHQDFITFTPEELGKVLTDLVRTKTAFIGIVSGLYHEEEIVICLAE